MRLGKNLTYLAEKNSKEFSEMSPRTQKILFKYDEIGFSFSEILFREAIIMIASPSASFSGDIFSPPLWGAENASDFLDLCKIVPPLQGERNAGVGVIELLSPSEIEARRLPRRRLEFEPLGGGFFLVTRLGREDISS